MQIVYSHKILSFFRYKWCARRILASWLRTSAFRRIWTSGHMDIQYISVLESKRMDSVCSNLTVIVWNQIEISLRIYISSAMDAIFPWPLRERCILWHPGFARANRRCMFAIQSVYATRFPRCDINTKFLNVHSALILHISLLVPLLPYELSSTPHNQLLWTVAWTDTALSWNSLIMVFSRPFGASYNTNYWNVLAGI